MAPGRRKRESDGTLKTCPISRREMGWGEGVQRCLARALVPGGCSRTGKLFLTKPLGNSIPRQHSAIEGCRECKKTERHTS